MTSTTDLRPNSKSGTAGDSTPRIGRQHGMQFLSEIESLAPWESWAERLANRKRPESLRKLIGRGTNPLEWSFNRSVESATIERVRKLSRLKRNWQPSEPADWCLVAREWLTHAESRSPSLSFALECLAWTHAMSRLAVRLPAETWWDLFAFLLNTANEACQSMQVDLDEPSEAAISQLMSGELPLTLAYWFPRVESCVALAPEARRTITNGIVELLDGEGMLHSRYEGVWRSLLACWTRCVYLDRSMRRGRIKKTARLQYDWFVRQSLRWRRPDGSLFFEDKSGFTVDRDELIEAALQIGGDQVDRELYSCTTGAKTAKTSQFHLPHAGEHSEWSEAAVLRTAWSPQSAYLGMTFNSSGFTSELGVADTVIWSGRDALDIRIDNEPLQIVSEWEELCWSSDDDVDYIELEARLTRNWCLQRQLLLAREDQFLFMADAVIGDRARKIEYSRDLPLSNGIKLKMLDETAEIGIKAKRMLGWIMPLALGEWKVDSSAGQFDGMTLRQRAVGQALYAPLFVDLDPQRKRKSRTWRQLTVAQQLGIVPRDAAVAYRVQIGRRQWIIYRSLGAKNNRTFIGQNITSEFQVSRFLKDGSTDVLLEIE